MSYKYRKVLKRWEALVKEYPDGVLMNCGCHVRVYSEDGYSITCVPCTPFCNVVFEMVNLARNNRIPVVVS
jgi:hypothetical protein